MENTENTETKPKRKRRIDILPEFANMTHQSFCRALEGYACCCKDD